MGRYLDRSNAAINRLVYDSLDAAADARLLEVGFGGGNLLFRIARDLRGGCIDGVDVSGEMVERARRRAARLGLDRCARLHQGSVEALPFGDTDFDGACSVHTIYFWPDLGSGLAELARVIRPGGKLVLGFSAGRALRDEGWTDHGFNAYSSRQIVDACHQQGFDLEGLDNTGREPHGRVYACRVVRR